MNCIRRYSTSGWHKTALITGGSKGIGYFIAQRLSEKGYNCILLARDESLLKHNISQLAKINNSQWHRYIKFDLSRDLSGLETLVNGYYDRKQGTAIDVLINCAGTTQNTILPLTSIENIQTIVNTNLVSSMVLSKLVSRNLLKYKKPGQIINISSILALDKYNPIKGTSVYATTKLALIGFTKKLSQELQDRNIHTNVILPSLIRDTEIGQSVNVEEFAQLGVQYVTKQGVADKVIHILDNDLNGEVTVV